MLEHQMETYLKNKELKFQKKQSDIYQYLNTVLTFQKQFLEPSLRKIYKNIKLIIS